MKHKDAPSGNNSSDNKKKNTDTKKLADKIGPAHKNLNTKDQERDQLKNPISNKPGKKK